MPVKVQSSIPFVSVKSGAGGCSLAGQTFKREAAGLCYSLLQGLFCAIKLKLMLRNFPGHIWKDCRNLNKMHKAEQTITTGDAEVNDAQVSCE